jgi:ABC-type polysaccharide/polyol phosphate transport system ATPase subunit
MESMKKNGTTIIFVSHDDKQVRKMCQNALWLVHGMTREIGEIQTVCENYKIYLLQKK